MPSLNPEPVNVSRDTQSDSPSVATPVLPNARKSRAVPAEQSGFELRKIQMTQRRPLSDDWLYWDPQTIHMYPHAEDPEEAPRARF